ncbi:MAG: GxxExxY protein [Thermodesulfobacteriota bacterium]
MKTNEEKIIYKKLSFKIIGLAMEVHSKLGYGFMEKVYENALMLLFKREGIDSKQQVPIKAYFEGEIVGDYIADILVYEKIILEIKALDEIIDIHRAQALNYLKATNLRLAIILNFGKKKLQYERLII